MKTTSLSLLALFLTSTLFFGCSSRSADARSISMLFNPSKKELEHREKIKETFAYIINDLGPGDSLAVHTPQEILSIDFSKNEAEAYVQKRNFRRKIMHYISELASKDAINDGPTIAQAKAYLDSKKMPRKSIIFCNPNQNLPLEVDTLEGYTLSMLNLGHDLEVINSIKSSIETVKGRFLLASSRDELNLALAYK